MKKYKIVVAGTRTFNKAHYQSKMKPMLSKLIYRLKGMGYEPVIISGKNKTVNKIGDIFGADYYGEEFAKEFKLEVEEYPADWDKHGKAAGPIRNEQMAKAANAVIVFWDGKSRGSKNMIDMAEKHNKPLRVKVY